MATATIRLIVDPETGKKHVVIAYESDGDALPMEHEEDHRLLVEKLIEGGALSAGDVGSIVIEREQSAPAASDSEAQEESLPQSLSEDA